MMDETELRKEIIKTALDMHRSGLVQGTGGNFSVRCAGGFIITPSGMDYALLAPEDLPKLSPDCELIEGTRTPSIESALHAAVYRMRPDVNAVAHTHSLYATAASALRRPLPCLTDNQAVMFGGDIPTARHAPIGTPALAENVSAALAGGAAVLMANHGALCVGKDLRQAADRCCMLELFAKIFFTAASAGGGTALSSEEAAEEAADIAARYGQK
ncbi:MAG: class II aldolase/adducin family protein [Synergistes sp.]|nr:class II aldolase/adducin family protein [Synergistes sp.]